MHKLTENVKKIHLVKMSNSHTATSGVYYNGTTAGLIKASKTTAGIDTSAYNRCVLIAEGGRKNLTTAAVRVTFLAGNSNDSSGATAITVGGTAAKFTNIAGATAIGELKIGGQARYLFSKISCTSCGATTSAGKPGTFTEFGISALLYQNKEVPVNQSVDFDI